MNWTGAIRIYLNYFTNKFHDSCIHTSSNNPSTLKRKNKFFCNIKKIETSFDSIIPRFNQARFTKNLTIYLHVMYKNLINAMQHDEKCPRSSYFTLRRKDNYMLSISRYLCIVRIHRYHIFFFEYNAQ
jgi:type IV secretory pathway TraG/TraD family ATPase VirD4